MDYFEQRFYLCIQKTSLLFKDLELILSIAKLNIEKEKLSAPYLTTRILDNYLSIIVEYRLCFENLYLIAISEMDVNKINGWIAGFSRSFENPLLNSEEWYQKIVEIQQELNQNFREINDFLSKRNY
jgi:hypothetical protein